MKSSFNIRQAFIIKFILLFLLLNPINTIDAKMDAHLSEEISTQKIEKATLFKKFKSKIKRTRAKWRDLSYGEKSFRLGIWVLICLPLTFATAGFTMILAIVFSIISIRLGLRSLKEKEEGISRKKRNRGIAISLITLTCLVLTVGFLLLAFGAIL